MLDRVQFQLADLGKRVEIVLIGGHPSFEIDGLLAAEFPLPLGAGRRHRLVHPAFYFSVKWGIGVLGFWGFGVIANHM